MIEIVICKCLKENEIKEISICPDCNMELIPLKDLQLKRQEIESQLRSLAIDLTIITAEIHLRTVRPIKSTLHITSDKPQPKLTNKEKARLEARKLVQRLMADVPEI